MPGRIALLMSAIERELDPTVRGRAATLLLRDLIEATATARAALDGAVRELRAHHVPDEHIAAELDVPIDWLSQDIGRPSGGRPSVSGPSVGRPPVGRPPVSRPSPGSPRDRADVEPAGGQLR